MNGVRMNGIDAASSGERERYYALQAAVYPKLAVFYDLLVRPFRARRRAVVRIAGFASGSRIVDVASGTGEEAFAFADAGAIVVGVDMSDAMLRRARAKSAHRGGGRVTFERADATRLPYRDADFDGASISFALHEMPPAVRDDVVREMVRVTKPGARIVVVDYALPAGPLFGRAVFAFVKLYERDNYVEFIRSDVDALLARHGVAVEEHHRLIAGAARVIVGRTAAEPVSEGAGHAPAHSGA